MMLRKIIKRIKFLVKFYIINKGDVANYLRSQGAKIGRNCSLLGGLSIFRNAEPYLVRIGDNVTLTDNVKLITHDGGTRVFRRKNKLWTKGTVKMGVIDIGDNVFVGVGTIILQNVRIGSNVVVGAGSVVTKDIPSNVVAAGVPTKVIYSIEEYTEKSLQNSITVPDDYLKNRKEFLIQHYWKDNNAC